MKPIYHQGIEEIFSAASPEQKILWREMFLKFGENISVRPFFWQGLDSSANNEFGTYKARMIYLVYEIEIAHRTSNSFPVNFVTYDENNAGFFQVTPNYTAFYNGTTAQPVYGWSSAVVKNTYFSRYLLAAQHYIRLIGFRIGI